MLSALLITLLTQAPPATGTPATTGAPSEEPTPASKSDVTGPSATTLTTDALKPEPDAVLKGVDLAFTVFNSTGTFFGAEGYSNSLTFWFEPSFAIGARLFKGSWLEKLAISGRIPLEVELAGNDPRFRGTGFSSAALYNPEALPIIEAQSGAVDGTDHRAALLGDSFLSLSHGHLFTIPALKIDVSSGLRTTIPTSSASRNAGLISTLGLGVILERKFGDTFTLGYLFRPTKYFYSRTQGSIAALGTTVTINGKPEQTWTPSSTGVANPDYGFMNGFWATLDLPKGFSVGLNYFLFNTKPYDVTGGCAPVDVPGVDVCRDGHGRPGVWRNEHWFLASVDFHHSFWSAGLGLSTFRSLENVDGSTSQPFFVSNRNNYTTLYLSFTATAEGVAGWATGKPEEKK